MGDRNAKKILKVPDTILERYPNFSYEEIAVLWNLYARKESDTLEVANFERKMMSRSFS